MKQREQLPPITVGEATALARLQIARWSLQRVLMHVGAVLRPCKLCGADLYVVPANAPGGEPIVIDMATNGDHRDACSALDIDNAENAPFIRKQPEAKREADPLAGARARHGRRE